MKTHYNKTGREIMNILAKGNRSEQWQKLLKHPHTVMFGGNETARNEIAKVAGLTEAEVNEWAQAVEARQSNRQAWLKEYAAKAV